MVDREMDDLLQRGQPDVDGDASAAPWVEREAAPGNDAGAGRAEEDFERRVLLVSPRVCAEIAADRDALAFVVIGSERAVAVAERAVAGGDRAGIALQCPLSVAAMA